MHVHIRAIDAFEACPITDENLEKICGTGVTRKTIGDALKAGNDPKCDIVIARPFIEHLMMSAVMTVAGRDTGATLFGPADMCALINHAITSHLLLN